MACLANFKQVGIDEAAEHLRVKPATIRDWIRKEKGLPSQKNRKVMEVKIL